MIMNYDDGITKNWSKIIRRLKLDNETESVLLDEGESVLYE